MFKKILSIFLILIFLTNLMPLSLSAEEANYSNTAYKAENLPSAERLFDGKRSTYTAVSENSTITLSREDGIAHIYIEFDRVPKEWTLIANGESYACGKQGFLHEYINVSDLCGTKTELTLKFSNETVISDIYAFGEGELPSFVQDWSAPCEKADIMLISSHSDDEQLFFAGLLPYYAIERKLQVQVVYIVQHFEVGNSKDHARPHEQLDGLWTVGIRNYPVMSNFPDVYSESKNRETAFKNAEKAFANVGVTYDDFKKYITETLRRFKPLVVVSHDLNGEYGHGTHVFCASALTEAINIAPDQTLYPESAEKYGTWRPEKTYLHLYSENKLIMDWDTPYESMGGKTPFQMTQQGFDCHKSQHWTWFKRWLYGNSGEITKATQIKTYSPCQFGLFDSSVGLDVSGGDFMENVTPYAERNTEPLEPETEEIPEIKPPVQKPDGKKIPDNSKKILWSGVIVFSFIILIIILLSITIKKNRRYR